jgi:hypothetical protein
VNIPEYVLAAVLTLFGLRSLRYWIRHPYSAESPGEQVLFVIHATARVGIWFTLAGFFVGYALVEVDDPQVFRWYLMVPIALAALQLLTSFYLSRSARPPSAGREG